ncbi:MAG TPA: bifunctional anthranilate synthase component I family protein/class IV aminotransferase [Acidimicrobiales bacterium]|jgi:para-aminobenzoate synthetase/4-amino-4-deoxychorismate lyase
MRCRIDHSAAGEGPLELQRLARQIEASTASDVHRVLSEAEDAARHGHYVAGFVSYEAAPAFDQALRIHQPRSAGLEPSSLPLAWFGVFAEALPATPLPTPTSAASLGGHGLGGWTSEIDGGRHGDALHSIHKAIAAGDAYLVNYTTRFARPWDADDDPFALYCRLVSSYSSGYHAYIETEQWAVACGSPELFFEFSSRRLTTRPMKGTAPRGRWSLEDTCRAEELLISPKERAENVMVVDLMRNDLGRIAVPGSVEVPELWKLERHPTLWQLTSTVTATTPPDVGLPDVFGALFPCASVTGAPKVSVMSIIAELEPSARGVYCGAVGLLQPPPADAPDQPRARFAVAIRTAVVDKVGQLARYGSGGGITWDSDPEREWAEVLLKAQSIVGHHSPGLGPDDGLIETMAFVPNEGGTVRNLQLHLARISASAEYFGWHAPLGAEAAIGDTVAGLTEPTRIRLVARPTGAVEIDTFELDPVRPTSVIRLCLDPEPVWSSEITVFHKTTRRERYEERTARHPDADDVVLVNERGEVTETTRANLAVCLDGQWFTPTLGCGLLPGVERARLLAAGQLRERVITVDELGTASQVATLSSLRGWRPAEFVAVRRCEGPSRA